MEQFALILKNVLSIDEEVFRVHDFVYRMTLYTKRGFAVELDFTALLYVCLHNLCVNVKIDPAAWQEVLLCTLIWIDKMHIDSGNTIWDLLPCHYSKRQIERLDCQSLKYIMYFPALLTSNCLRDVKQWMHVLEVPKGVICRGDVDDEDAVVVNVSDLLCDEVMMY